MKVTVGNYPKVRSKKKRIIRVNISRHDTYSMDHTLALVILPALKKYKQVACGSVIWGCCYKENDHELTGDDAVEASTAAIKKMTEMLDKMIFAFQSIVDDCAGTENQDAVSEGLKLFGEYYQALWW